jgi:uncharacterized protein YkwD
VHHRPASPPLSARVSGALTRWSLVLRALLRRTVSARLGRMALGALVTTTVVGLVLAIPVVSGVGRGSPAVELDSSASSSADRSPRNSPVVMGLDGRPVTSASFAGITTSGTVSHALTTTAASEDPPSSDSASDTAAAPGTTGATPTRSPSLSGTTAPGTSTAGSTSSSAGPGTTTGSPPSTGGGTTDPSGPTTSEPDRASAPPPAAPAAGLDPVPEVLALVNTERSELGCGSLVADGGLASTAQAHSAAMSDRGVVGLEGLDLTGLGGAAVAQGHPDAQSVVAGWLADPTDSATLLDCARTSIGIGVVDAPGGPWWTSLVS